MIARIIFLILLCSSALGAESLRTWHTIAGGYFEARLVEVQTTRVKLANAEGKTVEFPLADLKPSDRAYIREWLAAQGEGSEGSGAAAVERPAFTEKVFRDLVHLKGRGLRRFTPEPTAAPKYIAFYRSAQWCPPCRKFTPKLVDFYGRYKHQGAPFELVFISSDKSEEAMEAYMDEYDMEWPAFEFGENKDIIQRNGTGIPNLMVADAAGRKLLDSYDSSGNYIGPTRVMKELEALLKE